MSQSLSPSPFQHTLFHALFYIYLHKHMPWAQKVCQQLTDGRMQISIFDRDTRSDWRCQKSLIWLEVSQLGNVKSGLAFCWDKGQLPYEFSFIFWVTVIPDIVWQFGTDRICEKVAWKLHFNLMLLPGLIEYATKRGVFIRVLRPDPAPLCFLG